MVFDPTPLPKFRSRPQKNFTHKIHTTHLFDVEFDADYEYEI